MASISPSKSGRVAAALIAGAAVAAGLAWTIREHRPALPDDPLQLQILADAARRDDALARLERLARDGNVPARRALGLTLIHRALRPAEGLDWLRQAARAGDTDATFQLGKLLQGGAPGVPVDPAEAVQWLVPAAQADHPGAAYYLGIARRNGYGIAPDPAEAARWFAASARHNVPAALFMLANAYRAGEGVPRNDAEAVRLYEAAAEQDHPEALQTLAMAWRNGEMGLPRDEAQAQHYEMETAHALKHPALKP